MMKSEKTNASYWQEYGDYVLMVMPYADEVLVQGEGCTVRDADGRTLLDLASGMFCCVLGHNHPEFIRRVVAQTERLLHTGTQFLSPAVFDASRKLAEVAPGSLQKSVLFSTGTEANEFAFRLAKAYTGRTGIIGFSRGYYGTSLATKSCSGLFSRRLNEGLPVVPESTQLPITDDCIPCFTQQADSQSCAFRCLQWFESSVAHWDNIAAIIVEPFLSAGGMLVPPPGYLKALKHMAASHGALLIVDEAQTGFGRTGRWFAIEHHEVEPDILTLSKSIGNGFPAAAVMTRAEIADQAAADGLWNLSSHQSDPLAAAAISAVIDIVKSEELISRARDRGGYFLDKLRRLSERESLLANVRGQGLMIGFDFIPPDPERTSESVNAFMFGCRRAGVHLTYGYGSVSFRIIPPLVISEAEIDFAIEVIEATLASVAQGKIGKEVWPTNPFTRPIVDRAPWRHVVGKLWTSSPQQWADKGRSKLSTFLARR